MSSELQLFTFEQKEIRTIADGEGEPWFVAKDICAALEHSDVSVAVSRLDDDEKGTRIVCTPGGNQSMLCVNEPGLYALILTSRKAEAVAFKRWVKREVLPSIRKTGSYSMQATVPTDYLSALEALVEAEKAKRAQALEMEAQRKLLAEAQPKVEFFDAVADSKDAVPMGNVAKVLGVEGMGRNKLFAFLRGKKVLMRDNQPYQEFVDRGYFRVVEQKWSEPDGTVRVSFKTLVFQKGLDYIRRLLEKRCP